MKLGIMQPYWFPGLGYFDLIHRVDRWVVFDTAQYIRHGWVNRNRIHHPSRGWQYIGVPLAKHSRETPINEIRVSSDPRWKTRILGQLAHYRKHAPGYRTTVELVTRCLEADEPMLSRLNVRCLEAVCEWLELDFDYSYFSEMALELGPIEGPGDWALRITEAMGASEYLNFPGGEAIFERAKFAASNIELTIQGFEDFDYDSRPYEPIPGLSILDIMMWNEPARVRAHLGL